MTDNEIIKALKCCGINRDCSGCPKEKEPYGCYFVLCGGAFDLINRQKAEIERLNKDCEDVIYKLEYLLCNATGNKFSKYTYPIGDMVSYVNDYIQDCCNEAVEEAKEAVKSEAIKEFIDELKNRVVNKYEYTDIRVFKEIDNLVKEMTEESE